MKKIFLILFIMSFVISSIWAEKSSTNILKDPFGIQLPEKPNLNRTYEWYEYAVGGEATTLNWPTPERATFFEMWDYCIAYPATIEQVSHLFYEHGDYIWPDSTFHFKIYDADGTTLLHESGDLEAAHFVEYLYTLPTPLVVTNDFYVAVVPTDASGHPSSMSTDLHDGHSYTGSAGAWTAYAGYEFITGVYLEGTPTGARLAVTPDPYDFGSVEIGVPQTMTFVIENYCPTGEIIIDPAPGLTGDAAFTIISDNGAPYSTTIPTDQTTIEIEVQFTPTAVQAYSTVLSVYDNLTDNTTNINITGNGVYVTDCDWYIVGWDDYGDTWNGGYIDIYSNSVLMYTWAGPAAAGPDTLTFGIYEGETIDIVYTAGGWAYENEYCVYDFNWVQIACDGLSGAVPAGITGIAGTCIVPQCPDPTNLFTDGISRTRADLNWTAGGTETYWNVLWGLSGTFIPGTGGTLISGITTIPQPLTSLIVGTSYDWYVQADCDGPFVTGNESNWVGPITFSTAFNTPFTEGFEGGVLGWVMDGTNNSWEIDIPTGLAGTIGNPDPAAAHGGTKCAGTDLTVDGAYNSSESSYLMSPPIDCTSLTTVQLTFWRYLNVENGYDGTYVEVTNDYGSTWNDLGQPLYVQETAWTKVVIDATTLAAGNYVQFRWRLDSDTSVDYTGWNIDDILIDAISLNPPTDPDPAHLATNVSLNPTLTWTNNCFVDSSIVWFGDMTRALVIVDTLYGSAATYNPATLAYNTQYQWKIVNYNVTGNNSATSSTWILNTSTGYNLNVTPADPTLYGFASQQTIYTVNIENSGIYDTDYNLSVAGNTWTTVWTDNGVPTDATITNTGNIPFGTNVDFFVVVTVPAFPGGSQDVVDITVTSTHDPLATQTHQLTTTIPSQGTVCGDPLPLTLPAVAVTGNTVDYADDYNLDDISPGSYYLTGDDVVYQFTTTEEAILSGTIVTTGSWMGAFILIDCPNPITPPTPVIEKTSSSGTTITYYDLLPAGTYFLIISSWPSPQSLDYNINLSMAPLGVPANVLISVDAAGLTTVTWDAVTGADSYIVYGCDTPDGTFTDISADGSFTGESWTSTASLGDKKFIQISAVKTSRGNRIQPLTSEEREKMALEKDMGNSRIK